MSDPIGPRAFSRWEPALARSVSYRPSRPTPDHLALVQALIEAGQLERAEELLDAVWRPDQLNETLWHLRLWLMTRQCRLADALVLARRATGDLPGSATIACVLGVLEGVAGEAEAAVEAALRAAAIRPGHPVPERLLEQLLADPEPRAGSPDPRQAAVLEAPAVTAMPLNPVALAAQAQQLLFPPGSAAVYRPRQLPARGASGSAGAGPRTGSDRVRVLVVIAAMILAAFAAAKAPLLALAGLSLVVGWAARRPRA